MAQEAKAAIEGVCYRLKAEGVRLQKTARKFLQTALRKRAKGFGPTVSVAAGLDGARLRPRPVP